MAAILSRPQCVKKGMILIRLSLIKLRIPCSLFFSVIPLMPPGGWLIQTHTSHQGTSQACIAVKGNLALCGSVSLLGLSSVWVSNSNGSKSLTTRYFSCSLFMLELRSSLWNANNLKSPLISQSSHLFKCVACWTTNLLTAPNTYVYCHEDGTQV